MPGSTLSSRSGTRSSGKDMGLKQAISTLALKNYGAGIFGNTKRDNRVSPALSKKFDERLGVGQEWMPVSYGEYYPRSAMVYSAIKIQRNRLLIACTPFTSSCILVPLIVRTKVESLFPLPRIGIYVS